jgi:hypothetical protein
MRLPLIPPAELTPEQKSLYDEMRKGIKSNFNAFKVEREETLNGFNVPVDESRRGDRRLAGKRWK